MFGSMNCKKAVQSSIFALAIAFGVIGSLQLIVFDCIQGILHGYARFLQQS